jgi:hypothetical protein
VQPPRIQATIPEIAARALPTVVSITTRRIERDQFIESTGVRPSVVLTEPEHRVYFVNRSGRTVHLQFLMGNGEQHHLVQVPEHIWAIFHQVGRHPFVVHFLDRSVPDLYGAVEVVGDPYGRPDPLVCSGITVMGACLER